MECHQTHSWTWDTQDSAHMMEICLFTWGRQLLYGSGTPLWNPTYPFLVQRLDSSKSDVLHILSLHHWGKALLDLKVSLSLQCALAVIKANWHCGLHQQRHGQQAKGSYLSPVWDTNWREFNRDTKRWLWGSVELSVPKDMFHHYERDFTYDKYGNVRHLISKMGFSISLGAGLLSEGMHTWNRAKLNSDCISSPAVQPSAVLQCAVAQHDHGNPYSEVILQVQCWKKE